MMEIFTDGACRGNPGAAAIGVIIRKDGEIVKKISRNIGQATNNIAEYTALIVALQEALIQKADKVKVFTDSELMYKQVIGSYKVKDPTLKVLFDQVRHLSEGFASMEIRHVPREQNKDADILASNVLKKRQTDVVAPLF